MSVSTHPLIESPRGRVTRPSLADVTRYGRVDVMRAASSMSMSMSLRSSVESGASFSPGDGTITGLLAWYRADLGVTLNGSTVSAWADQSGTGDANKDATQATPANQPTFVASHANFNSRAVLSFDGTSDYLKTAAWAATASQPNTVYSVSRLTAAASIFIYDGFAAAARHAIFANAVTGNLTAFGGSSLNSTVSNTGVTRACCALFNGASSAFYVDTYTVASVSGNAGSASLTGLTIGASNANASFWNGHIGELIVFAGSHSLATRQTLMTYLSGLWGTAAPT